MEIHSCLRGKETDVIEVILLIWYFEKIYNKDRIRVSLTLSVVLVIWMEDNKHICINFVLKWLDKQTIEKGISVFPLDIWTNLRLNICNVIWIDRLFSKSRHDCNSMPTYKSSYVNIRISPFILRYFRICVPYKLCRLAQKIT